MTRWPLIAAATAVLLTLTAGLAARGIPRLRRARQRQPRISDRRRVRRQVPAQQLRARLPRRRAIITGGVGDPGPMFSQWLAAQTWDVIRFANRTAIDLFAWAHSLDLINGPQGALRPVNQAIRSLHENVLGAWWFLSAITLAGLWAVWKGLAQRRYPELATGLATSVLFLMIAFLFLYQPQQTIGTVSGWTNDLSLAFLAGTSGNHNTPKEAKREVSDSLFTSAIYEPWVVLQFGGFKNCVDTDQRNENGWPRPVKPTDPARDICRSNPATRRGRARRIRPPVPQTPRHVQGPRQGVRSTQGRGSPERPAVRRVPDRPRGRPRRRHSASRRRRRHGSSLSPRSAWGACSSACSSAPSACGSSSPKSSRSS